MAKAKKSKSKKRPVAKAKRHAAKKSVAKKKARPMKAKATKIEKCNAPEPARPDGISEGQPRQFERSWPHVTIANYVSELTSPPIPGLTQHISPNHLPWPAPRCLVP